MTEEIIIDGVNVAGCYWKCKDGDCAMYYADLSADNNELEFGFNCEDNTDCYFKQLKRLKQENAELQAYKDVNEDFKKAWDELNKKYNEVLSLAKQNADSNEYCLQELEKENEKLRKENERLAETPQWRQIKNMANNNNYRKALEEIRHFAGQRFTNGLNAEADHYNKDMQAIEDRINEVLNDT